MYRAFFKRLSDILLAVCAIAVLLLPMAVIALIVATDSPGPVIFRQKRLGFRGKSFTVLKFRTMCDHAYEMGGIATSESDSRITRSGRLLRRYSLDELPQLFNILVGKMSFVGPRPILDWEFENDYTKPEYITRFDVRPGLFCAVDAAHRSADRQLQFEMDAEYVRRCSFTLDVKTFFAVLRTVLSGKGVYRDEPM